MLASADISVVQITRDLAALGVEAGLLVPTKTGLDKAIMDATAPIRDYLKLATVHDYEVQGQGEEHKVLLASFLVGTHSLEDSRASLYRPTTKSGDPRIWFSKLGSYAKPGNLLVILAEGHTLFVVNASNSLIWGSRKQAGSPLHSLLSRLSASTGRAATELLTKLRAICALGFVPSVRRSDTWVGATLEHHLGIATNSSKSPDYKGIEIKATRKKVGGRRNRVNLFSQVPDWDASSCKNGLDLIKKHGYPENAPQRLCCTVREVPNAQGLYLKVEDTKGVLRGLATRDGRTEDVCEWKLAMLHDRLREKHAETFWVKAEVKKDASGAEQFRYVEVQHTRSPLLTALAPMVAGGLVTMDFTLKLKPSGKTRDHGYLFKILAKDFDVLFPPSQHYRLDARPSAETGH